MNLWKQLQALTATEGPVWIGQITGFAGTRCTAQVLPGMAEIEVDLNGHAVAVGERWIIRDQKLIELAPAGSVTDISV